MDLLSHEAGFVDFEADVLPALSNDAESEFNTRLNVTDVLQTVNDKNNSKIKDEISEKIGNNWVLIYIHDDLEIPKSDNLQKNRYYLHFDLRDIYFIFPTEKNEEIGKFFNRPFIGHYYGEL
jgi:hypothetical protein